MGDLLLSKINTQIEDTKSKYNNEPVIYCKNCLSLRIRGVQGADDFDYCDECGSVNTDSCSIEEWEALYTKKFGHKYLDEY